MLFNLLQKIWKDPVWSKVISVGVLTVIAWFVTWFTDSWPFLIAQFEIIKNLLTSRLDLPIWASIFIGLLLILLIPLIKFITKKKQPKFTKYNKDNFFDINWDWKWSSPHPMQDKYTIYDLTARCPNCSSLLEHNSYSAIYDCHNLQCDWQWKRTWDNNNLLNSHDVVSRVTTEIDRKVHSKEVG